jgi:hypothetical protein
MLIRSNPYSVYRPGFQMDSRGVLIVTRKWIVATRLYAIVWR